MWVERLLIGWIDGEDVDEGGWFTVAADLLISLKVGSCWPPPMLCFREGLLLESVVSLIEPIDGL